MIILGLDTLDLTIVLGSLISKSQVILQAAVYFESVAKVSPSEATSPLEELGRFHPEIWFLGPVVLPVETFTTAQLNTGRWLVDSLSPIAASAEPDEAELVRTFAEPNRYDALKLFPARVWEFTVWNRADFIGFFGCWIGVFAVLSVLWLVLSIGS